MKLGNKDIFKIACGFVFMILVIVYFVLYDSYDFSSNAYQNNIKWDNFLSLTFKALGRVFDF